MTTRRYFFFGLTSALPATRAAGTQRKVLLCLIDGLGPEYIAQSDMPGLRKLMQSGVYVEGTGVMPSLTNVNSASFATGVYPDRHGITANTLHDPKLGRIVEMSVPSYLLAPTVFESARAKGWKTRLIAAKDKVRSLLGSHADSAESAESQSVPMYQAAANYWVFDQARKALRSPGLDLLYVTTTDYMMHTFAPGQAQSIEHLHRLDQTLSGIVDDHAKLELYLCADHGMNAKTTGIDPVRVLAGKGIRARAAAAIADKHKVHHKDLGGSLYVDLENKAHISRAREILIAETGIEEAIPRTQAARRFHLLPERTGDLFVLAAKDTALGALDQTRSEVEVRTHGSLHEVRVPLLVYGRKFSTLETIVDLTKQRAWEQRA